MITFPSSLDNLSNPASTDYLDTVDHANQHADANDAIEALEAKIGINSSAVATSLDYLVKNASSVNPGHAHTGASIQAGSITQSNLAAGAIDLGTIAASTAWTSYTPSVSGNGSMTYTSQTITTARYIKMGRLVVANVRVTGTIGGVLNTTLVFSIPVPAATIYASIDPSGSVTYVDGGAKTAGIIIGNGDQTNFGICHYDSSNWTSGSARSFSTTFAYESAT